MKRKVCVACVELLFRFAFLQHFILNFFLHFLLKARMKRREDAKIKKIKLEKRRVKVEKTNNTEWFISISIHRHLFLTLHPTFFGFSLSKIPRTLGRRLNQLTHQLHRSHSQRPGSLLQSQKDQVAEDQLKLKLLRRYSKLMRRGSRRAREFWVLAVKRKHWLKLRPKLRLQLRLHRQLRGRQRGERRPRDVWRRGRGSR